MRRWIPQLTTALRAEIAEIAKGGFKTSVRVSAPRPKRPEDLNTGGVSAIWFQVDHSDGYIPVGGAGKLSPGGVQLDAVVVASEPGRLLLSVEHPSGQLYLIDPSELVIDTTQLLAKLIQRLEEADSGMWGVNWNLLDRVEGSPEATVSRAHVGRKLVAGLSSEQAAVIEMALGSDVLFVQGPPGTGKTHTIAALIQALMARDESVLLTSHTHVAVDQALLKVLESKDEPSTELRTDRLVRFGEPRLAGIPSAVVAASAADFEKPPEASFATLSKVYMDQTMLGMQWDTVVIDEVSMVNAALALLALGKAKRRVVLVGDPHQLPPIVQSEAPIAKEWLGRDMFEMCRAMERRCFARITVQRRMRPEIAEIARTLRYATDELRDHPETLRRDISDLDAGPLGRAPVVRIKAVLPQGSTFSWRTSRWNLSSALTTVEVARQLCGALHLAPDDADERPIGLITPFTAQRRLLLRLASAAGILPHVLPGTVHTFQGNECRIVLFDATLTPPVRAARLINPDFREDVTRDLNVAVTRARDQFALIASARVIAEAPGASGLGRLDRATAGAPRVGWSPSNDSDSWHTRRRPLEKEGDESWVPADSVAYVLGAGRSSVSKPQVQEWLNQGVQVVVVDKAADLPPGENPDGMLLVPWKDKVPRFILTDQALVGRAGGRWIDVRHEESARFLISLLRLEDIRAHVVSEGIICPNCDSVLELTDHLGGNDRGDSLYFVCPEWGRDCHGHIEKVRPPARKSGSLRGVERDPEPAHRSQPPVPEYMVRPEKLEIVSVREPERTSVTELTGLAVLEMIPAAPQAARIQTGLIFRLDGHVCLDRGRRVLDRLAEGSFTAA